jgi:hypothetical protein
MTGPERIWIDPPAIDTYHEGFSIMSTPAGTVNEPDLWPEYIRSDLARARVAERDAEIERLREALKALATEPLEGELMAPWIREKVKKARAALQETKP